MTEANIFASFLVLGFAVFVAGFLAGLLAIGLSPMKIEFVALFTLFSLGFVIGALMVALVLVAFQLLKLKKTT